ncbi:nicotinamidase-related amidase [Inquilinus ginsengisoli]|uniref:Nicotinamidase-related amidase n=1 Tax=Inquilinus ginsengisoli TaxID=363840 RepID=A0ABU1JNH7_9PROT|nr:isochorismatase family protein [Inquilinus ginsengisoli]MDR6289872.1 nicotinamidase-related amidase [Inquilinus ginsengisoli]
MTAMTLLAHAGVRLEPAALSESVLVLIDMQREYDDGRLALPGVGPAVAAAASLLARARRLGAPVIHVQQQGRPGGLFDPAGPMADPIAALAPATGEVVVKKSLPNAFAGTDLADRIAATGRGKLVVVGFMAHMCVDSTTRSALDHGLATTIVAAACASRDLPDPLGGVRPAAEVHRAALAALADRFAVVVAQGDAVRD